MWDEGLTFQATSNAEQVIQPPNCKAHVSSFPALASSAPGYRLGLLRNIWLHICVLRAIQCFMTHKKSLIGPVKKTYSKRKTKHKVNIKCRLIFVSPHTYFDP